MLYSPRISSRSRGRTQPHVLVLACLTWFAPLPAFAADVIEVSRCPGQSAPLPVNFRIDCSHVTDAGLRDNCAKFIENQACLVFRAYRKITDIQLEKSCRTISYTIYDTDKFPFPGGAGGVTAACKVHYMAEYSVKPAPGSKIGPYDTHELLHAYQEPLGALPDAHVLFGSSMAEAARLIGEDDSKQGLVIMDKDTQQMQKDLGANKDCKLAQIVIEQTLYLQNSLNVYSFYRKLKPGVERDLVPRQVRFSRMFFDVSGGKDTVKKFLLDHGCPPF